MSTSDDVIRSWQFLGAIDPRSIVDARLQLHWAAQPIAAANATLAKKQSDDGHTTLTWLPRAQVLAGQRLGGKRLALRPSDASLVSVDEDGAIDAAQPVTGQTLTALEAWATQQVHSWLPQTEQKTLQRPGYDLPQHAVGDGAVFDAAPGDAVVEVGRWFNDAAMVLETVAAQHAHTSAVRNWPHHFDLATLITLDPDETDAEKARSIGVGMTPGDGMIAEPYFYVGPWPTPSIDNLPALDGGGTWRTDGWVGATLSASTLVADTEAAAQAERVRTFLTSAIAGARKLLGA